METPIYPTDLNYHQDIRPIGEQNWGSTFERLAQKPQAISVVEAFPPSDDVEHMAADSMTAATDRPIADDYALITECFKNKPTSLTAGRLQEVSGHKQADPDGFPEDDRTGLTRLTEAFAFNTFGKSIRLYNFGNTLMGDEELAATANAVRSMEQKTGGALSESLSVIAILPDGHPTQLFYAGDDRVASGGGSAFIGKGLVTIGEKSLGLPSTQPEKPIERYPEPTTKLGRVSQKWKNLVETNHKRQARERRDQAILRSEIAAHTISYEQILVHEFGHILEGRDPTIKDALRWDVGKESEPSNYAKKNVHEHLAEMALARFTGGLHDQAVGPKHRQLYQQFLNNVNAEQNGPAFVGVQELDISQL